MAAATEVEQNTLDAEFRHVQDSTVSERTKKAYFTYQVKFIKFIFKHFRSFVKEEFLFEFSSRFSDKQLDLDELKVLLDAVDPDLNVDQRAQYEKDLNKLDKEIIAFVRHWLRDAPANAPIDFSEVTADIVVKGALSLRKKDGTRPDKATLSQFRSAVKSLFKMYGQENDQVHEDRLTYLYRGVGRVTRKRISDNGGKVKVGKDPLQFSDLKNLAESFQTSPKKTDIFGHAFLLLCWNLMCRSVNCVNICVQHLDWKMDALSIWFSHSKCDQMGTKEKDPRHIYANPINPAICPITALGVYLLCNPAIVHSTHLFPGGSQYQRFSGRLLHHGAELLTKLGIDIGCHSVRKGAASFVSSGSTSGPSAAAICIRAGWSMGAVQDRYIRYEGAGDMYVGRTVVGLPIGDAKFATLPPFFEHVDDEVLGVLHDCFPTIEGNMRRVCVFLVASVVYHSDFLLEKLTSSHPLFSTCLFTKTNRLVLLKTKVSCRLPTPDDALQPPPHVTALVQTHQLNETVKGLYKEVRASGKQTTQDVQAFLEEKAVGMGTITADRLGGVVNSSIERALSGIGLNGDFVRRIREGENRSSAPATDHQERPDNAWFQFSPRVPNDFVYFKGTFSIAAQHWFCGNPFQGYPPLRQLTSEQFPNRDKQARFADLKFMMDLIENEARRKKYWIKNPTPGEAAEIATKAQHILRVPLITESGRQRRIEQLEWTTLVRLVRKSNPTGTRKRKRVSNQAA